jgi:son of sevenless-like protein
MHTIPRYVIINQSSLLIYLGVYLTDLTMIDSGNSDTCKDQPQMINFHKRLLLAQVMQDIRRFQCGQYDFVKNAALWEWLEQEPARNPQEVYEMSLVAEPREPSTTE